MKHSGCSWRGNDLPDSFLFCSIVFFSIILQAGTCFAAPPGLVAWWRGDGNAFDSAGTNNPSDVTGVGYRDGQVGQAFQYDGSTSLISVPRSPSLTVSNLTVEAWIFPADDSRPRPIIDCGGPGQASSIQLWVNTTGWMNVNPGALHALIRDESGGYEVDDPDPVAPMNKWSHVALTADAETRILRLYCNGRLVATAAAPGALRQGLFSNVNIGYRDAASRELLAGLHFSGGLDEIKIYDRVLNEGQIRASYLAGIHGKSDTGKEDGIVSAGTQVLPGVNVSVVNPDPTLSISNNGANIFLSWPASAANFKLQGADTLTPLTVWSNLAVTLETNSDKIIVTVPVSKSSQFFRLMRP